MEYSSFKKSNKNIFFKYLFLSNMKIIRKYFVYIVFRLPTSCNKEIIKKICCLTEKTKTKKRTKTKSNESKSKVVEIAKQNLKQGLVEFSVSSNRNSREAHESEKTSDLSLYITKQGEVN